MRLLDVDIEKLLNELSIDELYKFTENMPEICSTQKIKKQLIQIEREDLNNLINDEKAVYDIKNIKAKREQEENLKRAGKTGSIRSISEKEAKFLVNRAILMRKGKKFYDEIKNKSNEDIEKLKQQLSINSVKNKMYKNDLFYGISDEEKIEIINNIEAKRDVQALVDNIPEKKFANAKSQFEENCRLTGGNFAREKHIKDLLNIFLGASTETVSYIAIVDIANAFSTREKTTEIQSKLAKEAIKKEKKLGFFARIFNRFKRKNKTLPQGISEEQVSNKNNFKEDLNVPVDQANQYMNNVKQKDSTDLEKNNEVDNNKML